MSATMQLPASPRPDHLFRLHHGIELFRCHASAADRFVLQRRAILVGGFRDPRSRDQVDPVGGISGSTPVKRPTSAETSITRLTIRSAGIGCTSINDSAISISFQPVANSLSAMTISPECMKARASSFRKSRPLLVMIIRSSCKHLSTIYGSLAPRHPTWIGWRLSG